jgi:hypothetical protein
MAKDPLGQQQQEQQEAQELTCRTVTNIVDTYYESINYYDRREARRALRTILINCYLPGMFLIYQFAGIPWDETTTVFKMLLHIFHKRQLKTCLAYSCPSFAKQELFKRALTNLLHVCVTVDFF